MPLPVTLRALQYRNYRLFFAGQLISLSGTWMQNVAQAWLVYRLTGSAVLLGAAGFSAQIPVFLLAPVGGVVADREHVVAPQRQSGSLAQRAGGDWSRNMKSGALQYIGAMPARVTFFFPLGDESGTTTYPNDPAGVFPPAGPAWP